MVNVADIARTEQVATYLRLITRWWWLPLVLGLASGGLVYAGTRYTSKPLYGASVTMVVNSPGTSTYHTADDAASYAVLMTTGPVMEQAARSMGPVGKRDRSSLYSTRCTADVNDVYLMCEARGHDDQAVAANLNHLAATFITLVSRQRSGQYEKSLAGLRAQEHALRTEITSLQNRLATLQVSGNQSLTSQYQSTALQSQITQDQGSLSQLTVQESQAQQSLDQVKSAVHVVNPAVPSPTDLGPSAGKNALLGVVVGILFAIGLVVLFEYLDDTFRSIDEVGEVTKLSVLGAVQPYKQAGGSPFHAWQELHSGVAEAYRVIRTNIQFTSIDKSPGVITITSARDGEGKSTTAVNLAIAMALSQQRVLLVDADLRRQGLTSRFGYQQVSGLSDALINPGIDVGVTVEEVPNLTVVPAGPIPPNPAELLGSDRMTEWLEKQRNMYDVVILDSPPVLSVADGRILSAVSDAVVMLADPTISSRRLVKQARFALATVGTPIIGVVINKARFYSQESYYTYFYYDDKRETPHPLPVAGDPIASSPDRIQVS